MREGRKTYLFRSKADSRVVWYSGGIVAVTSLDISTHFRTFDSETYTAMKYEKWFVINFNSNPANPKTESAKRER